MSAIFETEFRDLPDEEGNITKASTAKLVLLALADHANDEGEGAYPGLTKMERKTALSRQTVINTYGALKHNGIIYLAGISKRNTNNYTINVRSFPKANDDSQPILLVNPLDSTSQAALLEIVKPLDPNHPLTINETSADDFSTKNTAYRRGEQESPDKVAAMLEMAKFPGAKLQARIDAILSYLGAALQRNTETKEWKEFAKYVDSERQTKGWDVQVFVQWMKSQKGYDPAYWSCRRMREFYPMAFVQNEPEEDWRDRSHAL